MRDNEGPRWVVWASANPPGVEYCTVTQRPSGWVLAGSVVRRSRENAALLNYLIEADAGWRTKKATLEQVLGGNRRTRNIQVRRSRWLVDGEEDRRFRGCVDVDLQASPVTNTLPIRRTKMKVGSRVDLTACWVRFPSLKVAPLRQSYERLGKNRYRYSSATGFSTEVEVDEFGLVRRYGDYWLAI